MKKLYTLLFVLGLFLVKTNAQNRDTLYFYSKTLPLSQQSVRDLDSMKFKAFPDSVLVYADGMAQAKFRFGARDLDSISFTKVVVGQSPTVTVVSQARIGDTCYFSFSVNNGGSPIQLVGYEMSSTAGIFNVPYPDLNSYQVQLTPIAPEGNGVYSAKVYIPSTQGLTVAFAAVNATGNGYKIIGFEAEAPGLASFGVTNTTLVGVGDASVTLNIAIDGGSQITERGIYYNTDMSYVDMNLGTKQAASTNGTGDFSIDLTGLNPATVYYYKGYVTNANGTKYNTIGSFKTLALKVVTGEVSELTASTAKVNFTIPDDGGSSITESGVYISTSNVVDETSEKYSNSFSDPNGNYTVSLANLLPNTTYYTRAYAINANGTELGAMISFKTIVVSIENQNANTPVTQTSITLSASATGTFNERGIVWSTTNNPTINSNKIVANAGQGSFTATITGLTGGTNYYARTYVLTNGGVVYSNVILVSTLSAPVVFGTMTDTPSQAFDYTTLFTTITDDGGGNGISEYGIEFNIEADFSNHGSSWGKFIYNSSTLPLILNSPFSSTPPLFSVGNNYQIYVRAYAKNNSGTYYSDVKFISYPIND
jgi:hypothetical protein